MKHAGISFFLTFLVVIVTAYSQRRGWPCDYGLRPGNVWFYNSMDDTTIWSVTALRDSIGADGVYWIYVEAPRFMSGYWYRIDSACTFDIYNHPSDKEFDRVFKASVDLGDSWLVDTNEYGASEYARVVSVRGTKGHTRKEVLYYLLDERGGVVEPVTQEWSEGIGISGIQFFKLIGRIIDGVHYGSTSDVEENVVETGGRIAVHPLPAAASARLMIMATNDRTTTIAIHDMFGHRVQYNEGIALTSGMNMIPLDLIALSPGTYIIAVELDGERMTAPLVIVQ